MLIGGFVLFGIQLIYGNWSSSSRVTIPKRARKDLWLSSTDVEKHVGFPERELRGSLVTLILPTSTFNRILSGFHRTFATGVACRQGTLTPPDTWSRPFGTCICSTCWDQSFSELVVIFSGLCSSNISRYFLDFAFLSTAVLQYFWRSCLMCLNNFLRRMDKDFVEHLDKPLMNRF